MAWKKQVLQCLTRLGVKLLFLCSHLFILFLSLRLVDVLCLAGGISQWRGTLQPSSLSIRALTNILEQRAISYQNVVEKSDVVKLVEESGHVTQNGVANILRAPENTEVTVTNFSRGVQFYKRVMISAEVWLAIIVASDDIYDADNTTMIPEMSGKNWPTFQHRLSQLSVRIAILDCGQDHTWCRNKKYTTTRFQLFTPCAYKEEPKFLLHTEGYSLLYVYRWIFKILQGCVRPVALPSELKSKWLTFGHPLQWPDLHVVILTDQKLLPPFILALSAQYKSWATFVWARVAGKNSLPRWTHSLDVSAEDMSFPVILAATNEGVYVYGQNSEECYTYTCLRTFLHYFKTTQNASLYASFVLAILLGLLEAVIYKTRVLSRVLKNTFVNFVVVIFVWILPVVEYAHCIARAFRYLAIKQLGTLVRGDVVFFVNHIYILLFTLPLAMYVMKRLTPKIVGDINEEEEEKRGDDDEAENSRVNEDEDSSEEISGQLGVRANEDLQTDRESEPEPEETEQQQLGYRILLPLGSILTREAGDSDNGNQLTAEAEERLLTFLIAQMRLAESAPRHVTTDLPVWDFSSETQVPEGFRGSPLCVICQDDFRQDDKMTGLPCEHIFHHACLVRWLNEGASDACPLCRN